MRLIQCGGIRDPLTPLFTREGIDEEMRRTDQPLLHGGGGLDGDQLIYEGLIKAATKLTQGLGQNKVGLRRIDVVVSEAAGIHDSKVGPQALADILIGGAQFMLAQLQGSQDAYGTGTSATVEGRGEPLLKTLLDGAHQCRPGKGLSPLTDGMGLGHKVGDVQSCSRPAQPMLKKVHKAHRGLSCSEKGREPQDTMRRSTCQVPRRNREKTSDH